MKLHNTLSGTIEDFVPLEAGKAKLYTCGLTVYSQPHIGNWVGYVYWDVLVRVLKAEGYNVERTQNITDVGHLVSDDDSGEDKMEKGARAEGVTAWDVAKKYAKVAEHEAYDMLGLIRPDHLVTATSCIDKQIEFAKILDEKGYLYRTDDGMYFDTSKLDDYGKLAKLDIAGLEAGARVNMAGKKNPTDFAVWKFSPKDQQRDMEWVSPWGKGFPGWHLECSVIARETLGDQIDIHTGGIDHIPVHHTNEIAQTESVTGKPFATYWLHNNHIKVDGTKISKSLGNIYTLQDVVDHGYTMDDFKLMVLSKHYRTEGNFTWDILQAAAQRLKNWKNTAVLRHQQNAQSTPTTNSDDKWLDKSLRAITLALTNDINTPSALATIDELLGGIHENPAIAPQHDILKLLESIDSLLGLQLVATTPDISDAAKLQIEKREAARANKDWHTSDELRSALVDLKIEVLDTPHGTTWQYL